MHDTDSSFSGRSREQLTRVVRNLLDNATRHAETAVRISLGTTTDAASSNGRDHGGDGAEAVDDGRGPTVVLVGLAMVRTIAQRHGGLATITDATDPVLTGARVVVTLPDAG